MIVFGEHVCHWVAERTGGTYYAGSGQGIGLEKNGALIAGVLYDNCNGRSVQMHVAATGKTWLNREFLWKCFDYPFNQLKVHKIIGLVDSENADALRFDRHLGFETEAIIKNAGRRCDMIILSMTKDKCRFLGVKRASSIAA